MNSPIDPVRLLGRRSKVETTNGCYVGTIVAAGVHGVDITAPHGVIRVAANDVLAISVS